MLRVQHNQSNQKPTLQDQLLSQGQVPVAILSSPSTGGASLDSDFQKSVQIIHLLSSYHEQLKNRLKQKGFFTREKEFDTWTSAPLSVGMVLPDWERIDPDTTKATKPYFDLLFKEMIGAFTRTHALGLSILERERLAAILQELQIGISSSSTDEDLSTEALKGAYSILSAQVILFPEPVFYQFAQGMEPQISLRMVETKSTRITAAFSSALSLKQPDSINSIASDLVNKTVRTLQDQYPLQGKIVSCNNHDNDHDVEINLGSVVGILKDQSFAVLSQMKNEQPKGTIRVKSVYEHSALAEVLDRQGEFEVGDRVKAVAKEQ